MSFTYKRGTSTRVVRVSLSDWDYEAAKELGNGFASHGLRQALYDYQWRASLSKHIAGDVPEVFLEGTQNARFLK